MIVDTSALMAILNDEEGVDELSGALATEDSFIPAPALVEFRRVVSHRKSAALERKAEVLLAELFSGRLKILEFRADHALSAAVANGRYGTRVAQGGTLNLLDLMVYGCAREQALPILCTGRDFTATDADIHPASRTAF